MNWRAKKRKLMRTFIVQKPITLGYGSNVQQTTPTRNKQHQAGSILHLDMEAPNGNVWFFDADNERGKIECGELANLIKDGRVFESTT